MEENKNLQIRIKSWEHYAMVLQSYKAVYYFVKIYVAIMVKITFEIKSNIFLPFFKGKKKFYRLPG